MKESWKHNGSQKKISLIYRNSKHDKKWKFFFLQSWELKNAWRRTRKYAMFSMGRQINTLDFYTLVYVTSRGYDTDPYVQEKNRQWWFFFFS